MADLSTLFRTKPFLNPESNTKASSKPFSFQPQPQPSAFQAQPWPSPPRQNPGLSISVSAQSRKLITYDSMQEEISWFESQNFLECLAKVGLVGLAIFLLYERDWMGANTALSAFIFVSLMMGLEHCVFGTGLAKLWVDCSLIGTTLILVNQIFLFFINRINPHAGQFLFDSHYCLIPSGYITVMTTIFLRSRSLLSRPVPTNLLRNILQYPSSLLQLLTTTYKLRYALLQVYSLMLAITFLASIFALYNGDTVEIEELFWNILHPTVLLAQGLTFWAVVFALHGVLRLVNGLIGRLAFLLMYNDKNKDTKLPIILQLLRVNANDTFGGYSDARNYQGQSLLLMLTKFLRLDFSFLNPSSQARKLTPRELENIHSHSLSYLKDLLVVNPNALNTRITTSKFYNSYYDIFREFSQLELRKCSSALFQLGNMIAGFMALRARQKGLREDLFYWGRIAKSQFEIWSKAEQCCRLLKIVDQILEILTLAELDSEQWLQSPIGFTLKQIRGHTDTLRTNPKLNQIIREKMSEYYNKASRILKQQ